MRPRDRLWGIDSSILFLVIAGIIAFAIAANAAPYEGQASVSATVSETIDVTLTNTSVGFGTINPGTNNNPATNALNISINTVTNVNTNISQNATGFTGPASLALSNLKYNNQSGTTGATSMTSSYVDPVYIDWWNITKPSGNPTYIYSWYLLNIPAAQTAGEYQTTIYINVSKYV